MAAPDPARSSTGPATGEEPVVAVVGLVERFRPPFAASPRTRSERPPGYGVQEQCLPFTSAAALGFLVPSPFSWGFCERGAVPAGGRAFRSPVEGEGSGRCFYVVDDPERGFVANRYDVPPRVQKLVGSAPLPGLSFFDRADQQDMVKVHLPYVWRTPAEVAVLFGEPLNRLRDDGLRVLAGVVETSWFANPVNLVLRLPAAPGAVHVPAGEPLAQAVPVHESLRRPRLEVLDGHRRATRDVLGEVGALRQRLARDRSAYRHEARSHHGRTDAGDAGGVP